MKVYNQIPDLSHSVITIGSFDGVHRGHRHLIEHTRAIASKHACEEYILTFEPHPRIVLQPHSDFKLLKTTEEKLQLMENLGVKNVILVPFTKSVSELSAEEFIETFIIQKLKPVAVVLGYDHKFGKDRKGSKETFIQLNQKLGKPFEIYHVEEYSFENFKVSSTEIRNKITDHHLLEANNLLGYEYHITGRVVEGKKIGRTIGYPTANIAVDNSYKLIPPNGIYKTRILVGSESYIAATSISTNPTISAENARTIESYILDFEGDIYGNEVTLYFEEYIRGEEKFESLDVLKSNIAEDVAKIRRSV